MPTRKHDNKKKAPVEERDSAIVPPKENARKMERSLDAGTKKAGGQVTALSTVGKNKKPK